MTNSAFALARAELIRVLTAYSGITTGDGTLGGTTLRDANLINNPLVVPAAIPEKSILILTGTSAGEDKGAASFNNVTGDITLQGTGFNTQIKAGTIYRILNISSVEIDVATIDTKIGTNVDPAGTTTLFAWLVNLFAALAGAIGLTTFTQVAAAGVAADGVNEVELYDGTGITKPTKICGFTITMTGVAWAGHPTVWIEDGDGNKIFPFQATYVEGTDFADGEQVVFNFEVVVPVASGYSVRFQSSAAGDNAGQTLTLNNLDVIEVG